MKLTATNILLTIVCAVSPLGLAAQTSDWASIGRYSADNAAIRARADLPEGLVVFIGNSITDGWPDNHPGFFTANNFVGRGISGQTTYQFLVRFRSDVIDLAPAAVVINGGINDIAENNYAYCEDLTFGNLVSMVELARAAGIKVILTTLVPSSRCGWNPSITDVAEKVASLNARIRAYVEANYLPLIDYFTPMVASDGRALNPAYSNDGVHPTPDGYTVMERAALPVITQALKN